MRQPALLRSTAALVLCATLLPAQSQLPLAEKSRGPIGWRSYTGSMVAPVNLNNTQRIYSLIRAGNLYLTAQDALTLAIENNLNLEVDRYALPSADWALQREYAGGPIRGVSTGSSSVSLSNSGIGVLGALSAGGQGGGTGGGNGGAIIQQIGPAIVNFDPSLTGALVGAHQTTVFSNLAAAGINPLVDSISVSQVQLQQGLDSGGSVYYRNYYNTQRENAPGDILNPVRSAYMRVHVQQPLLQGYGIALNNRRIRVAANGTTVAKETFRGQLLTLAATVLNQYWSLVNATSELKMRQRALEVTQKFYDQTKLEISLGALPRVQLPRFEAEVASRRQDLVISESQLRLMESALKQQLVRREDAIIEAARIVPVDSIEIPEQDNLPPLRELVATAMAKRPDIALTKIAQQNAAISAIGTTNGLLPSLIVSADTLNRGIAGTSQPFHGRSAPDSSIGGYGTALGQIFRRDFPTESAGMSLSGLPLWNHQAQADYGIEQMQLQTAQLTNQRSMNAIEVNVSNQVIALQQARSRYSTAVNTRKLQEQILEDDQKKFAYGTATFNNLITDERALVSAQISEVNAMATYARARVSLDQVLGQTLESNHISLEEGLNGQVSRPSQIPESVGASKN